MQRFTGTYYGHPSDIAGIFAKVTDTVVEFDFLMISMQQRTVASVINN